MSINQFLLTGLTTLGLASAAFADGRNPGSLLLFPEFDNRAANVTLLTVTNTNSDFTPLPNNGGFSGSVRVEFVYIGKYAPGGSTLPCLETNREHLLTPNDTLTLLTYAHNPQHEQGFVYAFAKNPQTGQAIVFNHLIGNVVTLNGLWSLDYSMNPVSFLGIGSGAGTPTDLDGDGIRDLDGTEYEAVTDEILVPRFLGQGGSFASELILVGLAGGRLFDTIVNFWIYNDNEEAFSAQYLFRCWDRVALGSINGAFNQSFLVQTNHAPNEILGANTRESGWFRVYGATAFSTAEQIIDPAVYAVLVEIIGSHGAADLPFESPVLNDPRNGALFPVGPFGDGDPIPVNGDNQ
ncbi:MAG: hypothetical protein JNK02_05985 [Planctomycetes bacterium]|nr:hypothetical protein [Planctomycetota bacterium]